MKMQVEEQNMLTNEEKPQICVVCVAAYNQGMQHGKWIDAAQTIKEIYKEIKQMLTKSPIANAGKWEVHEFKGFGPLSIEGHISIEKIHAIASFIVVHGALGAALIAHYEGNLEAAEKALEEQYCGEYTEDIDVSDEFEEPYLDDISDNTNLHYEFLNWNTFINDYFSLELNGKIHFFRTY